MEKRIIVPESKIKYEGYFNISEIYYLIEELLNRLRYDKKEDIHDVRVYKSHRYLKVELKPTIDISEYVKHELAITIEADKVTDTNVKDGNVQKPMQMGKISFKFKGTQLTNQAKHWSSKPTFFIVRTLMDRLIYSGYLGETGEQLKNHIELMKHEISAYLNMNKFRYKMAKP